MEEMPAAQADRREAVVRVQSSKRTIDHRLHNSSLSLLMVLANLKLGRRRAGRRLGLVDQI